MTLLAPLFFQAALAVAAVVVGLHFIVTRQPPSSALPTARFVPPGSVQVTTVSRPRDLLLLLLRVVTVLLVGLAFARPVRTPERVPHARIVLADVSFAIGDPTQLRDTVRALLRPHDVLIAFDSAARMLVPAAFDTLTPGRADARLSPALVTALRAAGELRARADSIELVVVSPLQASALDAATLVIRDLWPGPIRLVETATREPAESTAGVAVQAPSDDGLRIALRVDTTDAGVRVVRGELTADDSAWAATGRTLVHWPASGMPTGFQPRSQPDTAGAVIAGDDALVFPLHREWQQADSRARVIARWIDGSAAALERPVGDGCIRSVAVPVPERGDLVLRPSFGRLAHTLTKPCSADRIGPAIDADTRSALSGHGPLVHRDAIPAPDNVVVPIVPWLLGAALLLALLELFVRRGRHSVQEQTDLAPMERAA